MMKYFTKDWCFGDLDDDNIQEVKKNYWEYINHIKDSLPFALKLLASNMNLHDGIISKASCSSEKKSLRIEGIFGDLQTGYFKLKIEYLNISEPDINDLKTIFEGRTIEIISDEIELVSQRLFSHRLLFSTKKEIEIRFSDIEIKINSASTESYKKEICQFTSE